MKRINYFYWYNGQSPLANCCNWLNDWLLPEVGTVNVCICGRSERPKWIYEAMEKAEQRKSKTS